MKGATGIDTSTLVSKTNLANLKTKIDNLDGDEPKSVHADLSKLSNVVDDAILKKLCMINWLLFNHYSNPVWYKDNNFLRQIQFI